MLEERKRTRSLHKAVMLLAIVAVAAGMLAPVSMLRAESVYAATEYKFKAHGAAFYTDGMTGMCCHRGAGSPPKGKVTRKKQCPMQTTFG